MEKVRRIQKMTSANAAMNHDTDVVWATWTATERVTLVRVFGGIANVPDRAGATGGIIRYAIRVRRQNETLVAIDTEANLQTLLDKGNLWWLGQYVVSAGDKDGHVEEEFDLATVRTLQIGDVVELVLRPSWEDGTNAVCKNTVLFQIMTKTPG